MHLCVKRMAQWIMPVLIRTCISAACPRSVIMRRKVITLWSKIWKRGATCSLHARTHKGTETEQHAHPGLGYCPTTRQARAIINRPMQGVSRYKSKSERGGQRKVVPAQTIKAYGGVEVQFHSFLTATLDDCCATAQFTGHPPCRLWFNPRPIHVTLVMGSWH